MQQKEGGQGYRVGGGGVAASVRLWVDALGKLLTFEARG